MAGKARCVDDTIIVRPGPGEAIKSRRIRRFWQECLKANIAEALSRRDIPHEIHQGFERLFVITPDREAALCAELAPFGKVDLDDPEVTVRVEVMGGGALISDERRPGAGGMPGGMQGRALVLLSGGYDSAVAARRVMRRGAEVDFLLCNLGGAAFERQVLQIAKLLTEAWGAGLSPRLHVVDFAGLAAEIRDAARSDHWQLVLKRQMYAAAAEVAAETGAQVLVTGEALGQVSSQTLSNLAAIETGTTPPVLRPLVGMDKPDILAEAARIGTAPLSARVREFCALDAKPVVRTTPARVDRQAARLDPDALSRAVAARRVLDLNRIGAVSAGFRRISPNGTEWQRSRRESSRCGGRAGAAVVRVRRSCGGGGGPRRFPFAPDGPVALGTRAATRRGRLDQRPRTCRVSQSHRQLNQPERRNDRKRAQGAAPDRLEGCAAAHGGLRGPDRDASARRVRGARL